MIRGSDLAGAVALACVLFGSSAARGGEPEIEVILDCSGSMLEKVDGRPKIDVAKESLVALVDAIPDGTRVGLRAYGHRYAVDNRVPEQVKKSCGDTELLLPIAPIDKLATKAKVNALACHGMTPLGYSLAVAAHDFDRSAEKTVILISDGIETCGLDPLVQIDRMKAVGFKMCVHLIGLAVSPDERAQLSKIPAASGGKYFDAKNPLELVESLKAAVKESLPELAAKDLVFLESTYTAKGVEVLNDRGDWLEVKDLRGGLMTVPKYLCVPLARLPVASVKVGADVFAATVTVNRKPSQLHQGKIVESKEGHVRVARIASSDILIPPEGLFQVPRLPLEGKGVRLVPLKMPPPRDRSDDPANMLRDDEAFAGGRASFSGTFPLGLTFKVDKGPRELRRLAFVPDPGASALPAVVEVWTGVAGEKGVVWQPVGVIDTPPFPSWLVFKLPPTKAELLHLRIVKTAEGPSGNPVIYRLRAFEDDGAFGLPVKQILDPSPPVGEAGELERKATEVLLDEGDGRYRQVKVLKKDGESVVAITHDGKKVTVAAAKTSPLVPVELAKLELGDDVLVNEGATGGGWNDVFVKAVVTETSSTELKVQLGSRVYRADPKQVYKVPAAASEKK